MTKKLYAIAENDLPSKWWKDGKYKELPPDALEKLALWEWAEKNGYEPMSVGNGLYLVFERNANRIGSVLNADGTVIYKKSWLSALKAARAAVEAKMEQTWPVYVSWMGKKSILNLRRLNPETSRGVSFSAKGEEDQQLWDARRYLDNSYNWPIMPTAEAESIIAEARNKAVECWKWNGSSYATLRHVRWLRYEGGKLLEWWSDGIERGSSGMFDVNDPHWHPQTLAEQEAEIAAAREKVKPKPTVREQIDAELDCGYVQKAMRFLAEAIDELRKERK